MTTRSRPVFQIQLRVGELRQLFNSMDPAPFHSKDLDRDAEAYIESWAMATAAGGLLHVTIHVDEAATHPDATRLMSDAIHNHFSEKATLTRNELKLMLRQGVLSLLIGTAFVGVCVFAALSIKQYGTGRTESIIAEGLTIVGWVALWRPVQTFLYDWWPLRRRIRVYRQLTRARIDVLSGNPA